jgi:hypothetical protein
MISDDCSSNIHEFCNPCDCSCHGIQVSNEEVSILLDYFINRAGYISYETDMPLHIFIRKLQDYEKTQKITEIE